MTIAGDLSADNALVKQECERIERELKPYIDILNAENEILLAVTIAECTVKTGE